MQKIAIGICDDDKNIQNNLYNALEEYGSIHSCEFDIYTFSFGEDLLESKTIFQCDLLFLDVEMGNLDGIQTAQLLRDPAELENLQIVFVTAHDKYMKSMFDVRPFQFLSKPVSKEKLFETMDNFCKLFIRKCEYFSFQTARTVHRIPCGQILYLESKGRKLCLHTTVECFEFYGKLDVAETELANAGFYRIHQSFLINPNLIAEYSPRQVMMKNGVAIPISDKYKSRFLKMQFSS